MWTALFADVALSSATVTAAALVASGADLARRARPVSRSAAAGLSAYALWCAFATALSGDLWRRNRDT